MWLNPFSACPGRFRAIATDFVKGFPKEPSRAPGESSRWHFPGSPCCKPRSPDINCVQKIWIAGLLESRPVGGHLYWNSGKPQKDIVWRICRRRYIGRPGEQLHSGSGAKAWPLQVARPTGGENSSQRSSCKLLPKCCHPDPVRFQRFASTRSYWPYGQCLWPGSWKSPSSHHDGYQIGCRCIYSSYNVPSLNGNCRATDKHDLPDRAAPWLPATEHKRAR